jgi:hypothetical protein
MFIILSEQTFLLCCFTKYQNEAEIFEHTLGMYLLVSTALLENISTIVTIVFTHIYIPVTLCSVGQSSAMQFRVV